MVSAVLDSRFNVALWIFQRHPKYDVVDALRRCQHRCWEFVDPHPPRMQRQLSSTNLSFHITDGCHPYPAVQADGSVSGGLEWSGADDGDCKGSAWGSQVYARSAWYNNKYAIMYAWYFPKGKGRQHVHKLHSGHRHEWEFAVVWVDQPSADHSNLLGVSMSFGPSFHKEAPVQPEHVVGSSIKLDSYSTFWGAKQGLRVTTDIGTTQDLIQWEQLTDAARASLTETNFDIDEAVVPVEMPLKDDVFQLKLNSTYPF
uniref:Necrosis-inducing protein NPP1 n=1 Tax=Phytophthora cinnamomi TaxID=4785 RepID=NPP1_PHYCI|nr:RecName: Full=Necrosis-inducing protein NPP1 [Phytophthora cinnamomi]CAL47421.1 necrosis-inducing protein [Phytophthora cinnamomi]